MKLQMVDVVGQYKHIKPAVDAAVLRVLDSGQFINGPDVGELECTLAGYLGVRYAAGCASGTDALQIAMMALGIGPGDEVITTPFTFVATAETIGLLGARPVYVDIDPLTFNIDPRRIEAAITPRTKAIIPVHLYGHPADMDAILAVVLGGTLMTGGRFSLLASAIGALVIWAFTISMYTVGVPAAALLAAKAVLVLVVILLYSDYTRRLMNRLFTRKGPQHGATD